MTEWSNQINESVWLYYWWFFIVPGFLGYLSGMCSYYVLSDFDGFGGGWNHFRQTLPGILSAIAAVNLIPLASFSRGQLVGISILVGFNGINWLLQNAMVESAKRKKLENENHDQVKKYENL